MGSQVDWDWQCYPHQWALDLPSLFQMFLGLPTSGQYSHYISAMKQCVNSATQLITERNFKPETKWLHSQLIRNLGKNARNTYYSPRTGDTISILELSATTTKYLFSSPITWPRHNNSNSSWFCIVSRGMIGIVAIICPHFVTIFYTVQHGHFSHKTSLASYTVVYLYDMELMWCTQNSRNP